MSYGLSALQAKTQLINENKELPKFELNAQEKELKKQTDSFEAIIVKMLMDNAMKDDKDIFSSQNDPGDKIYKSMYRDELSKASAGSFGFSEMLFDYLSQKK
ncbi:MAG: hypothetical protein ABXS93_08375 [Sulfurimonas sp.]